MIPAVALVRGIARLAPSALDVQSDADDFVLDARGVSALPTLVAPEGDTLRAAIEEALTRGAAFVEVTSVTGDGCTRARWQRAGEAPTSSTVRVPASLSPSTLRVHVRQPWGAEVVKDFFRRHRPELDVLREAAVAPRFPVTIAGEPLVRPAALAQAALTGLDDGMRGAIELVTVETPATLTLCERGWAVASWPTDPLPGCWYAEEPLRDDAPHIALYDALQRAGSIPTHLGGVTLGKVIRETYQKARGRLTGTIWTLARQRGGPSYRVAWHPLDHETHGISAEVRLPCRLWIDLDGAPEGIDPTAPPQRVVAAVRRAAEAAWRSLLDTFDDPVAALPEATQAALRAVLIAGVVREGAVVPPWRGGAGVEAGAYRGASVEGQSAAWLPTPAAVSRLAEMPLLPVRDGPATALHTLLVELARAPFGQLTALPVRDLQPRALAAEAAHADLVAVDLERQVALLRRLRAVDPATRTLSAALPWPSHHSLRAAMWEKRRALNDAPTLVLEEPAWEVWRGEGLAIQLQGFRLRESVYDAWVEPVIDGVASMDHRYGVGTTRGWHWVIRAKGTSIARHQSSGPDWGLPGHLARAVGRVLLRLATTPLDALPATFRVTYLAEGVRLEEVFASQGPELFCLGLSLDPAVVTAARPELDLLLGGHEAAIGALTDEDGGIARLAPRTRWWVHLGGDEALGAWHPEARANPWLRAAVRFVEQVIYRWSRGRGRFRPFAHERAASGALLVLHQGVPVRVVPLGATSPLAVGVVDDPTLGDALSAHDRFLARMPEHAVGGPHLRPEDFSWACHLTNEPLARALCDAIRRAAQRLADPAAVAILAPRLCVLRQRFRPSGEAFEPVREALAALPLGDDGAPDTLLNLSLAIKELAAAADPSPLTLSPERRDALRAWLFRCWRPGPPLDAHHDLLRAAAIWRTISGRYVALGAVSPPYVVVDEVLRALRTRTADSPVSHVAPNRFPADMIVVPTATFEHTAAPHGAGRAWTAWRVPEVFASMVKVLLPGATMHAECGDAPAHTVSV